MNITLTDRHYTAMSLLTGLSEDECRDMVQSYEPRQFPFRYCDVARLADIPEATLRRRVHDGYYTEGVDYKRDGARTVRFSRRVVARELEKSA